MPPIDKSKLNEFTTDIDDPPAFRKSVEDKPFPEDFKETIRTEFPELKPAIIQGKSIEEVFHAAEQAAHSVTRWQITHAEGPPEGCIEGFYTSLFMRTKEDFTVRIAAGSAPNEVVVNVRTRSRGEGGLDGNIRIASFLAELEEALAD
jgi:hypothetical protein